MPTNSEDNAAVTRLAFSTLGCPDADLTEVLRLAGKHGFAGVELRAQPDQPVHVGLSGAERRHAVERLRDADITSLSIASYVKVATPDATDEQVIADGTDHLQLTADIGAEYLRVFPGGDPRPVDAEAQDNRASRRLAALATVAADLGVTLALETHDSHGRAQDAVRILSHPGCEDVKIIWDVLHTWLGEETPARSLALIGARLAYVQVKDVPSRADLTPVLMGDGSLPLLDAASALTDVGFDGWVSWEYERAWHPEQPSLAELAGRAASWTNDVFTTS